MNLNYYQISVGMNLINHLTIDMTKDKYTGRYRLGLNSIFVPKTSPF